MDQNNIWREQDGIVVLTDAAAACLSRPVVTCSTAMEEQLAVLKSAADTSLRLNLFVQMPCKGYHSEVKFMNCFC